ncbi:MAG: V-type ATP synthase subunit I [Treponema sp.]|nr:V-type ATP synthase subunit I [Treponema sp.]
MIKPRKMKHVDISVLNRDVDMVIEYLGRRGIIHFTEGEEDRAAPDINTFSESAGEQAGGKSRGMVGENLEKLKASAAWLGLELPQEPEESTVLPGEAEEKLAGKINAGVAALIGREKVLYQEKVKVEEALTEAQSFSGLHAPFSNLDQLSYLTLRIGRLDPKGQAGLREALGDRAVIIPLGAGKNGGPGDRILAAASRKGRFALDSELKKFSFTPITIPEGFQGVPKELLVGLETRLKNIQEDLERARKEKEGLKREWGPAIRELAASWLMASIVEELKEKIRATQNAYVLSGWVPQDNIGELAGKLSELTGGRVAIHTFNPEEMPEVTAGRKKVPVSLKHGAFVRGFEGVVFSYGAPLYGTIDPSPLVAFFFTLLFGIMFGDLGQGFVLLLAGFLTGKRGIKALKKFRKYSSPLIAVGISSMVMGFFTGSVFTNEELMTGPTLAITGFFGHPVKRILTLMPLAEHGGSMTKLFYFFGFTIAIGVILNSAGLILNIINHLMRKKYEGALFSKTGLAGLLLFWYAIFIALRCIFLKGRFMWFDMLGLLLPVLCIFFGPLIWRLATRARPVLEHGLMVFIMEGFVGILETASIYISNTVSFLRVGAFALSHAVLSYIVFRFSEEISGLRFPLGGGASLLILIFGNLVIILLEGMIVAIQVVRLQYYEFFSKFFAETGVEFSPFRFRKEAADTEP